MVHNFKAKGRTHPCRNFGIKSMWENPTHLPNLRGLSTKVYANHRHVNGQEECQYQRAQIFEAANIGLKMAKCVVQVLVGI